MISMVKFYYYVCNEFEGKKGVVMVLSLVKLFY